MTRKRGAQVQGLRFRVADLISETNCILSMGSQFFDAGSHEALHAFRARLEAIASCKEEVSKRVVLDTIQTREADIRGRSVYARIGGNWELTPISHRSKKAPYRRQVAISGIASTKVELFRVGEGESSNVAHRSR